MYRITNLTASTLFSESDRVPANSSIEVTAVDPSFAVAKARGFLEIVDLDQITENSEAARQ